MSTDWSTGHVWKHKKIYEQSMSQTCPSCRRPFYGPPPPGYRESDFHRLFPRAASRAEAKRRQQKGGWLGPLDYVIGLLCVLAVVFVGTATYRLLS